MMHSMHSMSPPAAAAPQLLEPRWPVHPPTRGPEAVAVRLAAHLGAVLLSGHSCRRQTGSGCCLQGGGMRRNRGSLHVVRTTGEEAFARPIILRSLDSPKAVGVCGSRPAACAAAARGATACASGPLDSQCSTSQYTSSSGNEGAPSGVGLILSRFTAGGCWCSSACCSSAGGVPPGHALGCDMLATHCRAAALTI